MKIVFKIKIILLNKILKKIVKKLKTIKINNR